MFLFHCVSCEWERVNTHASSMIVFGMNCIYITWRSVLLIDDSNKTNLISICTCKTFHQIVQIAIRNEVKFKSEPRAKVIIFTAYTVGFTQF